MDIVPPFVFPAPARAAVGLLVAAAIALAAWRARSLSPSGAAAAVVVGTLCAAAGFSWGALLIAFFVVSSLLSRWRATAKAARTRGVVAKGGERDAVQVLANGGPFAAAALLSLVHPWTGWYALGAGALAAATADTWGTEVGTLAGRSPRSVLSWQPVPPGTSGGITVPGTLASLAGALFVAALAAAAGWPGSAAVAAVIGGFAGSMADSVLGATMQARRRCDRCESWTEQTMHECGSATRHAAGLAWLDNDAVNLLSGMIGGGIALGLGLAWIARGSTA